MSSEGWACDGEKLPGNRLCVMLACMKCLSPTCQTAADGVETMVRRAKHEDRCPACSFLLPQNGAALLPLTLHEVTMVPTEPVDSGNN